MAVEGVHIPERIVQRAERCWEGRLCIAAVLLQLVLQLPVQVALQVAPALSCGATGDDCCKDVLLICLQQRTAEVGCIAGS